MFVRSALALAFAAAALPALAEEVRLTAPIEAGVISEGGVDLVAYYTTAADGAFVVTATWVSEEDATPHRTVLSLQPGDGTTFALPGHPRTLFRFGRHGDAVSVTSAPVWARTASL
jgi:hypothetical protein